MGLELIFNGIPFRLFHFIFPVIYGLIFIFANYLSHMQKRSIPTNIEGLKMTVIPPYPEILNWDTNKGWFLTLNVGSVLPCIGMV